MKYISTRGKAPVLGFEDVMLTGLASDGGLYVPEEMHRFTETQIAAFKGQSYQQIAFSVMKPFIGGAIEDAVLERMINASYAQFRSPEVDPLVTLGEDHHVLELFHGPTLSFKDFALQFLGRALDYALEKRKQKLVIIGATSGDTGSAAIEGCRHSKHITLFMLHPYGRVSDVQRRQMTTVMEPNIHNLAIEGTFDDCQNMVKAMFADQSFLNGRALSAVNSINWARIMAQVVYYFHAAVRLGAPENQVSFCVPTGNFGDIFAGYVARSMGLNIRQLIVATNANDILRRFFDANDYRMTGVTPTLAPSMDIQISSNFERLLFDAYGRDANAIAKLMDDLKQGSKFSADEKVLAKVRELFSSASADDAQIKATIKDTYEKYGYVADPHTATAIRAVGLKRTDSSTPVVSLATAHPAKFPDVSVEVLGKQPALPEHLRNLFEKPEKLARLSGELADVKAHIAAHL